MATDEQIADAIAGSYGTVPQDWRAHNVTRDGTFISDLTAALLRDERSSGLAGGALSCDNARDTIMEAAVRLLVDEIPGGLDALDHIELYEDLTVRPPGQAAEVVSFPLGRYLVSFADVEHPEDGHAIVTVKLHDLTAHLLRDKTTGAYTIGAATEYFAAMEAILDGRGLPHALPDGGSVLPVSHSRPLDTPWQEVLRDLAEGINYYRPWSGLDGTFVTRERIAPSDEEAAFHYRDDIEPRLIDAATPYVRTLDYVQSDNRMVVVADDPRRSDIAPKYVLYENADPASPISTASTGAMSTWELKSDTRPSTRTVLDLATMRDIARFELRRLACEARPVELVTFPDPRRGPRETYELTLDGVEAATKARVLSWSRALTPGAPMRHRLAIADAVSIAEVEE